MNCQFKHPDGRWNIVEQDEQGRVRLQCLVCGRHYPNKRREMRFIRQGAEIKGIGCNPQRRAARLSASRVERSKGRAKSCPENCINKAEAHQNGLLAELQAALIKSKNHELKAVLGRWIEHAQRNAIPAEVIKQAREMAVRQALQEGAEA